MGTDAIDSPESETNVLDAGVWEISESGWQHRTAAFCACETVDRAINYDGRRRTRLIESAEGDGEGYEFREMSGCVTGATTVCQCANRCPTSRHSWVAWGGGEGCARSLWSCI